MSRRRPSQVRHLVRQAALKTTGEVVPRGSGLVGSIEASQTQTARTAVTGISVRTQGKPDFLSNIHPALLEQVRKKELSVDQAYRQTQGRKKLPPPERVKQLCGNATSTSRVAIAQWVSETHHVAIRRQMATTNNLYS